MKPWPIMKRLRNERVLRGSVESARYQVRFGQQLFLEKQSCFATGQTWKTYVKETFGLSRERADELIRIGRGAVSVEEYRAKKKKNQRSLRRRHNLNEAAISKLGTYIHASVQASHKAKLRATKNEFSGEEIAKMREAIASAIFSWQELLDIFKP